MVGQELKQHCISNFIAQSRKAKIIKVVYDNGKGKTGTQKFTVRKSRAYENK